MAITIVQSATFAGNGAGPNAKAFLSNVTAGNLIVVASRGTGYSGAWTVSDNLNGAHTEVGTGQATPGGAGCRLFYRKNTAAGATTVSIGSAGQNFRGEMIEIAGLDTVAPLDQTAKANGTSTAPSSGATGARSQASEIIITLAGTDGGNTFSAGSGFTLREANNDVALQIAYQIVSAAGTDAGTMGLASAAGWASIVATFIAASAGAITDDDSGGLIQRVSQDLAVVSVW
jgi:hypothetical protein